MTSPFSFPSVQQLTYGTWSVHKGGREDFSLLPAFMGLKNKRHFEKVPLSCQIFRAAFTTQVLHAVVTYQIQAYAAA
jgi:hypothetical protein